MKRTEAAEVLPTSMTHGMGKELVEAHWPALTDGELHTVLSRFERLNAWSRSDAPQVQWRSPRPMSAGALVRVAGEVVFVKRHHLSVRSRARILVEHGFARHLRARGVSLPEALRSTGSETVVQEGDYFYEVHEAATGIDLYRDIPSWYPFASLEHARTAGSALALFHRAAADFPSAASAPGVLVNSAAIISSPKPLERLAELLAARPALARSLVEYPVIEDFTRYHLPRIEEARARLVALRTQWAHGDWHASNLTWSDDDPTATVVEVLDLGLANRTFVVHDLAVALERSTVDWLDLADVGAVTVNLDAVDAFLSGYELVQPLDHLEMAALIAVLPVAHLEFALSEVEYFAEVVHSRVNAELAYRQYFVGHTRWFEETSGAKLIDHLRPRGQRH